MKKLDIEDAFAPTNRKKIKEFEEYINAKLPKDYLGFLLLYNGGGFKQNIYEMIEPTHETLGLYETINWFYTLAKNYYSNLFKNYQIFQIRIPKELIPIGSDNFGNQICLAVRGNNYGKVYFWDHDNEEDEGKIPTYHNVYLIANSFTEFINKLYEDDPNDGVTELSNELQFDQKDLPSLIDEKGFVRLEPYAQVAIYSEELSGSYYKDVKIANRLAGIAETPKWCVWHHVEDGKTMLLVPAMTHDVVSHTGGAIILTSKKK